MRCGKCGRKLRAGDRYCPYCGTKAAPRTAPARLNVRKINDTLSKLIPAAWNKKFPRYGAIAFFIGYAVMVLILISAVSSLTGGRHGLHGLYTTSDGSFLFTKLVLSSDGTFEAWDDYCDWSGAADYHGTYRGFGKSYTLQFDNLAMRWCELDVEKSGDSSLRIEVIPISGGFIWRGSYAYFYQ